ncbi:hypothetical protein AB0C33_48095 [Nonomuraea sp. NPDC048881]|uniref:hypothetical protein n=1 Tax=Nonomuraea sp. NPDC048881 TaxID=3155030 RepID=UPI0033CE79F8
MFKRKSGSAGLAIAAAVAGVLASTVPAGPARAAAPVPLPHPYPGFGPAWPAPAGTAHVHNPAQAAHGGQGPLNKIASGVS